MDFEHLKEIGLSIATTKALNVDRRGAGCCPSTSSSSRAPAPPAPQKAAKPTDGRPIVTRFAPSPTGYLHIGGARTAMFCYLYARHNKGKFLMRIEDTDAERHDEGAVEAIVKGMAWLGCPHDGEIVRQSSRIKRHQEVAQQLLANGGAYKCYCSKEELDEMRAEAERNKVPFRYPGKWRYPTPDMKPPPGVEPCVRIKTPDDAGSTGWEDGVMGRIDVPNKDLDDFIILRPDGTPTYLLAVVVDDHEMGVTQVIRGSDHIPNTSRQICIFRNMNWELPNFAHIPLIHGPDGKKLSKRHGATGVEQYEALGYLPEAMRNYLARLSWAHGDDEIFSTEQAIEWFTLEGCSRSAPCFDYDKLNALNQHYIKEADPVRLAELTIKLFPECKAFEKKLKDPKVADLLKPRAKTMVEYKDAFDFIMAKRPIGVTAAAKKNIATDAQKATLTDLVDLFKSHKGEWSAESLEPLIKGYAERKGTKLGDVAKPARAALTGAVNSPGLFEVIWAVGKDECVSRFEDSIAAKNPTKEEPKPAAAPSAANAAPVAVPAAAAPTGPAPASVDLSGDLDAKVKAVGDEIRTLKAKLKADGLSGKKIDVHDDVKALVAKLTVLKEAAANGGAPAAAPAPAVAKTAAKPAVASGASKDEQIKAVGDEIRTLKAKLKESGLSGKKIDATPEVKELVAKLTELKSS
eukprot:TRINITY_DN20099_c0_g1_i1.p1 TRINITY_DN20099_c0_g1~~TRINITY_DN20099_c0_g1_i1.p1  ORF type:complete len:689 (+),score=183.61 TRINITY_DN20099_c0_g1_i1:81-2147(+)